MDPIQANFISVRRCTNRIRCPCKSEDYLDLALSMLSLRVTMKTNVAEENMTADLKKNLTNVRCINNLMNSLISRIDCFLNSKPVSPPYNLYTNISYIGTLLNYGPAAKNSQLTSVLSYKDTASNIDHTAEENEGLVARQSVIKDNTVDIVGFLHCDIRTEVKDLTLTSKTHGQTLDTIILGQPPKIIIVGFVENKGTTVTGIRIRLISRIWK